MIQLLHRYAKFLPIIAGLIISFGLAGQAHADSYSNANIIDNSIFLNYNSMNQTNIQNFLNSKGGAIAGYTDPTDNNASAASIIYSVSRHVGLNPQVIMATMQKEESLITDPSPSPTQYRFAMGYGCPDSGSCSYPGFYTQVINGAWQLRFDLERANGNTGSWTAPDGTTWGSGVSYPCPSATRYYSTGLYNGRTVTFSDDAGNAYTSFTIANAATAAMYCYTPHAYPGSGTQYYSGSYNFVVSFIAWWGAVHVPSYSAQYYGQSSWPSLVPGASTTSWFEYTNAGNTSWYDDSSIGGAPAGSYSVHLATSQPINRSSIFGSSWGGNHNRPALTLAAVYLANGSTLAPNQHVVAPGQIAKYSFTLTVPANQAVGTYQENFAPVAEGTSNGAFADPGTYQVVTVSPVYSSAGSSQSTNPTIRPGQSTPVTMSYKNTGNAAWYDDITVAGSPNGYPTHLITSNSINRASTFGTAWNSSANRPANIFSAVYLADGTTLAPNQHVVQPGQIGSYSFTLTAPNQLAAGSYHEGFMPVQDGSSDGAMNDPGTSLTVTVPSASTGNAVNTAVTSVAMVPGGTQQYTVNFTNTGNTTWTPGTTNLIGNPSTPYQNFKSSGWTSPTVVTPVNESSVAPGSVGTFTFSLTASNTAGLSNIEFAPSNDSTYATVSAAKFAITVAPPRYSDAYAGQSTYPTLLPGQTTTAYFEYSNTGNIPWYDDSSIGSAPAGSYPVHLATSQPINRNSPFGSSWGVNHNRPNLTFSAVYLADGTTLASNQHVVQIGQIAKFSFTFTAAANQAPGSYRESFMPVAEGTSNGAFNDPGTYLDLSVQRPIYSDSFAGQSNWPTVSRGGTAAGFFSYRNTGNVTWYDDTSIGSAPAGSYPVHLATSQPVNRNGVFGTSWGTNRNRPSLNFSAVYLADGTTLAPNQHVVQPGQIGKLSFLFTVSSNQASGTYRESFQPVAEGTPTGALNDPGTYLDVTVN